MKIVVWVHRPHRDYPWSVGRCRRLYVGDMTGESFRFAEWLTDLIRGRSDSRRELAAFWRITA